MKGKKIAAFHLLNDYSGSPLVFSQAMKTLQDNGYEVTLHTSNPESGFLAGVEVKKIRTPYRFFSNPLLRLTALFYSQLLSFLQVFRYHDRNTTIYVNTLLPFGAALAGKLSGKKVVYHLHETSIRPLILLRFLQTIASFTASKAIYVSHYLKEALPLKGVDSRIIYNSLPAEFIHKAQSGNKTNSIKNFTVLMVCSLKKYKGIFEFTALAARHPELNFEMVINASEKEIEENFPANSRSANLKIFPVQKNLHPFYERASLVVNLTNPALCVETFGMTLLEAMSYGIPVIAPPVGGPAEIVQNGENGYTADVRDTRYLDQLVQNLASQEVERARLSFHARETTKRFSPEEMGERILRVFNH